jgi:hypothetical protein
VSFTGRAVLVLGAALAILGSLLLPSKSAGGLVLVGFGLGMCASVGIVYMDARRWARA